MGAADGGDDGDVGADRRCQCRDVPDPAAPDLDHCRLGVVGDAENGEGDAELVVVRPR